MPKRLMQSLALFLLVAPQIVLGGPILHVDAESGVLTGASDVDVAGVLYSVSFADGTCSDLFGGCDEAGDFAFSSAFEARAAARALNDTVFVGEIDANPRLIAGCPGSGRTLGSCIALIPYSSTIIMGWNGSQAFNVSAINRPLHFHDVIGGTSVHIDLFHTGQCQRPQFCPPSWAPWSTWSVWTEQAAAAPETGTAWLVLMGLFAMRGARRRLTLRS